MGGTAELALGGGPAGGTGLRCGPHKGPANTPHVTQGTRNSLVPNEGGVLEPNVPTMQTLQQVTAVLWDSLAERTRVHTLSAGGCEAVPLGTMHHGPTHRDVLRANDGRLCTMQVMPKWRQKITDTVILALRCIFWRTRGRHGPLAHTVRTGRSGCTATRVRK